MRCLRFVQLLLLIVGLLGVISGGVKIWNYDFPGGVVLFVVSLILIVYLLFGGQKKEKPFMKNIKGVHELLFRLGGSDYLAFDTLARQNTQPGRERIMEVLRKRQNVKQTLLESIMFAILQHDEKELARLIAICNKDLDEADQIIERA